MANIEIRARGFGLTEALANKCEACFGRAISVCAREVRRITVVLFDVNGDHGGEAKSCRAVLTRLPGPLIVVEAIDRDLYRAIAIAAARVRRSLHRRRRADSCSRRHHDHSYGRRITS
jgi:hypothetical protein